eukprot:1912619-Pyramimonas_sp.AAC.1
MGIFPLPSHDWVIQRAYSLSPHTIGSNSGMVRARKKLRGAMSSLVVPVARLNKGLMAAKSPKLEERRHALRLAGPVSWRRFQRHFLAECERRLHAPHGLHTLEACTPTPTEPRTSQTCAS